MYLFLSCYVWEVLSFFLSLLCVCMYVIVHVCVATYIYGGQEASLQFLNIVCLYHLPFLFLLRQSY